MSISSQLLILNQTKQNINSAINLKGVSVTDEAFSAYPDKVRLIPNGGGIYESNIILYVEAKQENVVIPAGTETIGDYAFHCLYPRAVMSNLKTVSMPNTVTSIGYGAFNWNTGLSTINLSTALVSIGNFAFFHCHSLQSIVFPSSLRTIGNESFKHCSNLPSVTFSEGLTSIGEGAFNECSSLTSVTLPSTVTYIGTSAFSARSSSMTEFTCLATAPPTISESTLYLTNNCPIYVPDESVLAYQVADGWSTHSSRIKGLSEKPQ